MSFANLNTLIAIHSYMRWVVLALYFFSLIICLQRYIQKARRVSRADEKLIFWMVISMDMMLLIGTLLWIFGNNGLSLIIEYGMGEVMRSQAMRFSVVEHPLGMLLAIILLHIGKKKLAKGNSSQARPNGHSSYKSMLILGMIAFLLVLFSIPWPWRAVIGRPLLP